MFVRLTFSSYSSVVLSSAAESPPRNGWFGMSTTTTALRVWYCRAVPAAADPLFAQCAYRRTFCRSALISKLNFLPRRFCRFSVIKTSIITKLTIGTYYALQCILLFTTSTNADVDFAFCKITCLSCVLFISSVVVSVQVVGPILCFYRFSFRR